MDVKTVVKLVFRQLMWQTHSVWIIKPLVCTVFVPRRAKVIIDGKEYIGMANLGYNPTFTALKQASLEVNIFDFDQNVYGKQVNVMFIKHIRSEKKFPSINDLIEQLNKDKQQIINEMI